MLELDVGNGHGLTWFNGKAVHGDHVEVGFAGRVQLAVGNQCEALMASGEGAHGPALLALEGAKEGGFGAGVHGALGKLDLRGLDLGKATVHGGAGR